MTIAIAKVTSTLSLRITGLAEKVALETSNKCKRIVKVSEILNFVIDKYLSKETVQEYRTKTSTRQEHKMKLKKLLFPTLLALSLVACNEKTTHYEGTYYDQKKPKNNKDYSLIFEKIDNSTNEYKITSFFLGKPTIESGTIKNEKYLYSPRGTLMGEFEGNNFKTSTGIIFSKIE